MIEILVGVPGCGKSTYAKERAEKGWLIVDLDTIVTMLHGGDYTLYDENLKPIYKTIELDIIKTVLSIGANVVIDRCNNLVSTRERIIDLARQLNTDVMITYWPYQQDMHNEYVRRRLLNSRGHDKQRWQQVITRIANELEPPTVSELKHVNGCVITMP